MGGGASKPKKSKNAPATAGNTEAKTDQTSSAAAAPSAASENSESKTDESLPVTTESKSSESKTNEESAPPDEADAVNDIKSEESVEDIPRTDSIKRVQSIGDIFEGEQRRFTEKEALSAGSAFGNIFQQKAKDGEVMQSHKALVFDCGTGETKAIFLKYHRSDDDQPIVEVKELNKAPATLDFLKRKNASDNEDYKSKLKVVETNKDKKGRQAFATEEEREIARAKLNDGYWFLNEKPEGATDELLPQYFVDFCVQTKQKLIDSNQTPDTVMIGCSAWARDAGALQPEADALIIALSKVCDALLHAYDMFPLSTCQHLV